MKYRKSKNKKKKLMPVRTVNIWCIVSNYTEILMSHTLRNLISFFSLVIRCVTSKNVLYTLTLFKYQYQVFITSAVIHEITINKQEAWQPLVSSTLHFTSCFLISNSKMVAVLGFRAWAEQVLCVVLILNFWDPLRASVHIYLFFSVVSSPGSQRNK